MEKMKPGEKYLKILITIGNVDFEFPAFPNVSDNQKAPQFKGKNVSVWVNTKKEEQPKTESVI